MLQFRSVIYIYDVSKKAHFCRIFRTFEHHAPMLMKINISQQDAKRFRKYNMGRKLVLRSSNTKG